jgi:DNA polymerase III epsilon subunit-like protein
MVMSDPAFETYISVDVESAGPNPSQYSLLSIGACSVLGGQTTFYVELRPVNDEVVPEAISVSKLSFEKLKKTGLPASEAMFNFAGWISEVTPEGSQPVFVAFNASFDWMFVNDYFHRFLGYNPFGHSALDIKSYYMALHGVSWDETRMPYVAPRYKGDHQLTHHALKDAIDQADIFKEMLEEARIRKRES